MAIPCIFECDVDLIVVDTTIFPPPMIPPGMILTVALLLAPPPVLLLPLPPTPPFPPTNDDDDATAAVLLFSGMDVISTVVHSLPLARKTRLVTDRIYLVMYASIEGNDDERFIVVVVIADRGVGDDDMTISTAITGWTWELCANDAILVAVMLGKDDTTDGGIMNVVVGDDDDEDDEEDELPTTAAAAMLFIAFTFKYAGTA